MQNYAMQPNLSKKCLDKVTIRIELYMLLVL